MKKNLLFTLLASTLLTIGVSACKKTVEPETTTTQDQDQVTDQVADHDTIKSLYENETLKTADGTVKQAFTFIGTVTGFDGSKGCYIQEDGYGLYVYRGSATTTPGFDGIEVNDKIKVGTSASNGVKNYGGVIETNGAPILIEKVGQGDTITKSVISSYSDIKFEKQSLLTQVTCELTVNSVADTNLNVKVKFDETNEITIHFSNSSSDKEAVATLANGLQVGDKIKLDNTHLSYYKNAPQFVVLQSSEVTKVNQ